MLEKIQNVIREHLGDDSIEVTADTKFADLELDSLDMAELVMTLEDELGTEIEVDENLQTVGDLIKIAEA